MSWQAYPDNSRVWIYQSNRFLTAEEKTFLNESAKIFCKDWVSHGAGLKADAEVFHDLSLVLFVNQEHVEASGCSIDKSIRFVQSMEQELGNDFFNRMLVLFETESGKIIQDFREGVPNGANAYFDNTLTQLADFKQFWKKPLSEGWFAKLG